MENSYFVLLEKDIELLKSFISGEKEEILLNFREKKHKPNKSYNYVWKKGVYVGNIIKIESKIDLSNKLYDYGATLGDNFDIEIQYDEYKSISGYKGKATINMF